LDHCYSEDTKAAWDERWDWCELGGFARFEGEWKQSPVDAWVDWKTAIGLVLPSVELIYCLECIDFSILWTIARGWRSWCIRRGRNWMIDIIWRGMEGEWLVLLLCLYLLVARDACMTRCPDEGDRYVSGCARIKVEVYTWDQRVCRRRMRDCVEWREGVRNNYKSVIDWGVRKSEYLLGAFADCLQFCGVYTEAELRCLWE